MGRRADAPALHALHRSVLAEGRYFITTLDEFKHASASQKELLIGDLRRAPRGNIFVARIDGTIVGFAVVRGSVLSRMRHVGRLEIMVASGYRGRGIGVALMEAVVAWSEAASGLTKLALNVFDDNERAIGLYRRFGFVEEGRRPAEYLMEDGTYRGDVLMYRMV